MYNHPVQNSSYEIRKCHSCGLRYPLVIGHPIGTRCPVCLGDTELVLRRALVTESTGSASILQKRSAERAVILDNIRSAWNVGSIFRSADGFGFSHAYICGITPTPDNEAVTKTSLGAEDSVSWSYHKDAVILAKGLKKEGWRIFALEEQASATAISRATTPPYGMALVVGNEMSGVDPDLLDLCEDVLIIPMHGEKKSFNVAVAFGIAAYALARQ